MLALLLTAPHLASGQTKPEPAEVIFKNGSIYTVNAKQPRAEAIAVTRGKIVFVGSNQAVKAYAGQGTKVVDLHGATVVPGFTDSHFHLSGVGEREMTFNLGGVTSLAEFLSRVKERVEAAKPGEWITGRGWIETFWKPQAFPTRWDLDQVAPNNPVYLIRADGHGAVANSAALKVAGITKETPNPSGGEIMRDKTTGEPNGMLLDRAQGSVRLHLPAPKASDAEEALVRGAQFALAHGLCEVQIAGTTWSEIERLKQLYADGRMKLRIYAAIYGPGPDAEKLIHDGPLMRAYNDRLTIRDIKVVFDGALGSKGAALLEPYHDHNSSGFFTQRPEVLAPLFERALRAGIQVETHAIGDRANRTILDLYEQAFQAVPSAARKVREPRWRVEHAQIVHPSDIPRFAKLGVLPSMQPSHAIGDLHFAPSRLGIERLEGAYAWQSLLKSGSIIAGGSDAPVERGDPRIEFYAAVARKDLKGFSGAGWHPEQAVSREQALKMLTLWPAVAAFEEGRKGSLEPGKWADMTVLSADIMRIPFAAIPKTRVLMTVIGGEIVFAAKQSFKNKFRFSEPIPGPPSFRGTRKPRPPSFRGTRNLLLAFCSQTVMAERERPKQIPRKLGMTGTRRSFKKRKFMLNDYQAVGNSGWWMVDRLSTIHHPPSTIHKE